ncbi:MAG: phage holin family protein [Candidatus Binatia bacterium]|nr:phage holin family protein [Candidatus Binatia bacterium]
MTDRDYDGHSDGLWRSLKALLAALSAALHTRLDLFATELEEERERLKQTLVLTLLLFFGLGFGFILLTIFLVALFWERGWLFAIGGLAGVYLCVGIVAAFKLRSRFLTRPGLFPATLGELAKDRDRLRSSTRE